MREYCALAVVLIVREREKLLETTFRISADQMSEPCDDQLADFRFPLRNTQPLVQNSPIRKGIDIGKRELRTCCTEPNSEVASSSPDRFEPKHRIRRSA